MIILGLSPIDKDATVSVVKDGRLVYACSEERLTRVKQQPWFPFRALENALATLDLDPREVDGVAYAFLPYRRERALMRRCLLREFFSRELGEWVRASVPFHLANLARIVLKSRIHYKTDLALFAGLAQFGLLDKFNFFHHHLCHCASAYFTGGRDEALCISMDGYGSGLSGLVCVAKAGQPFRILQEIAFPHSLAILYQRLTVALGFQPDRHEGKVLGLAAYGNSDRLFPRVARRIRMEDGRLRVLDGCNPFIEPRLARRYDRADVAAAYQRAVEEAAVAVVRSALAHARVPHIVLAGGFFANVKVNQRIAELEGVESVFVHPAMGDQGTGTGAAFLLAAQRDPGLPPYRLPDAFLGPSYTDDDLEAAVRRSGLPFRKTSAIETDVAALLARGQVVARLAGRMEYGPRALGNRSILAEATRPEINDWLNRRLRRTEFMPFAPATLAERGDDCYLNLDRVRHAAEFMTVTVECREAMRRQSPAAIHVDGTARPQLVSARSNPSLHAILSRYHALTGVPTLINTSFNMHEEPIVCSPEDALRAYQEGHLDYLAMGNLLVGPDVARGDRP